MRPGYGAGTGNVTATRGLTAAALAAVYLIWGSTYYAIRVSLESFPPLGMAGVRFSAAGLLLYAFVRLSGTPAPTRRELGASALMGLFLLVAGNGAVVIAQQSVSSSFAALAVTTVPLWAALFSVLLGKRPSGREWIGLLVGFAGAVVLVSGGEVSTSGLHGLVILAAPISWAFGSALAHRLPLPKSPFLVAALEMAIAGPIMLAVGALAGERLTGAPTAAAIGAVVYLLVFGSLVGLSAYSYLIANTRPAIATSYAYVNPLVALLIGGTIAGEPISRSMIVGGGIVLAGVGILSTRSRPTQGGQPAE